MKGMIFALVLQGAALPAPGSLGIGIDVLPEAFSFAASRVSYAPELRLARCDGAACRWHLGDGVEMTARLSQRNLSVERVEAELDRPSAIDGETQYRKACLAIVALFDPQATEARRRAIAVAITTLPNDVPQVAVRDAGTRFYGAPMRCGAAAFAVDLGAQP